MKTRLYIIIAIVIGIIIGVGIFICYKFGMYRALVPIPIVNQYSDLIHITYPKSGDIISSTSSITITGEARGSWYFEASFPIVVVDWDGRIIGTGHGQAKGDWMTDEFVPFEGVVTFIVPVINDSNRVYASRGAVILKNDNPSGDPARDKAVEIPIIFK